MQNPCKKYLKKNNIEYFSITGSSEDKAKINMDNSGYTNMGGKLCEEYLDGNKIREEMLVNNLYLFFLNNFKLNIL